MGNNRTHLRALATSLALVIASAVIPTTAHSIDCGDVVLLQRNAASGNPAAELSLARMHYYAECGLLHDDSLVFSLTKQSAMQGLPAGETFLAYIFHKGIGTRPNTHEAARWAKRAAEQGDAAGQILLGGMYVKGEGGLPRDDVEADKWYILAQRNGQQSKALIAVRTLIELSMPSEALLEATRRADAWIKTPYAAIRAKQHN